MYELYDPCTVMFFFRNKHIMVDLGTGNNNKINWPLEDKQELIDIIGLSDIICLSHFSPNPSRRNGLQGSQKRPWPRRLSKGLLNEVQILITRVHSTPGLTSHRGATFSGPGAVRVPIASAHETPFTPAAPSLVFCV